MYDLIDMDMKLYGSSDYFYNDLKFSCNLTYLNGISSMQIRVSKGGDFEYLFSFLICSMAIARTIQCLPLA